MFKNTKVDPRNYKGLSIVDCAGIISIRIGNKAKFGRPSIGKSLSMKVADYNNLDELKQNEVMSNFFEQGKNFFDSGGNSSSTMMFAWESCLPEYEKAETIELLKKLQAKKEIARRNANAIHEQQMKEIFG